MGPVMVLVVAAALGVDYGYQPSADGGLEYIIQIEPQLLESLKKGEDVVSDIPLNLRGVHHYRITVGNKPLPKQDGNAEKPPALESPALKSDAAASTKAGKATPGTFAAEPDSKPMEHVVNHVAKAEGDGANAKTAANDQPDPSTELARKHAGADELAERPWLPLALALALFGSLGANIYMAWVTASTKSHYRRLVRGGRDQWPLGE